MRDIKIPRVISACRKSGYKNYSYRLPCFIDSFIRIESAGDKMKVIDGLCLYALDIIKGKCLCITKKDYGSISYNLGEHSVMIDCSKKLKASNHYLSDTLTFILSSFLSGYSLSVKITILCYIAINRLRKNKEIIVSY